MWNKTLQNDKNVLSRRNEKPARRFQLIVVQGEKAAEGQVGGELAWGLHQEGGRDKTERRDVIRVQNVG
jgi:hypothetical protein